MGDLPQGRWSSDVVTRSYQQEMLDASLIGNIIVAQDTGSGKTHIAVLRMKIERDREPRKVSWFIAPTVALCEQQHDVIEKAIGSVGLILGRMEPTLWTDPSLWKDILRKNRVIVSTPQVLLDALSHGYISLGQDIGLLIFDEAHHAKDNHPMNRIMRDFYHRLPIRRSIIANSHGPVREERPVILGLTASPMFGGNVAMAFSKLEANLDSDIRSPRQHRDELEANVYRPEFRNVFYSTPLTDEVCFSASKNFRAFMQVARSMDIWEDPYVLFLAESLAKLPLGTERTRLDRLLSETISKSDSYTHKGIKDIVNTGRDIYLDLGPWAADWYIQRVVEMALDNVSPYAEIATVLQAKEKAYLIDHLKEIDIAPVSYMPQSIERGVADKVRVLIQTLEEEKRRAESLDEPYSGIVFVKRRAAVLALTEVLEHHPRTKNSFRIGCLLGTSESSERVTFLDITRRTLRQPQAKTLDEFRSGDKNLVIATSVAEEGLDIQACGNVIRWDIPDNMASFAQSRGRARKKHSSFVLMLNREDPNEARITQFERLERDMVAQYTDQRPAKRPRLLSPESDDEFEPCEFKVELTGALLTLQAAISRLNRFCSVLPNSRHTNYAPIYDIDPPDLPEGWHALPDKERVVPESKGPFGCTLTLPKVVPLELRVHTVERRYPSKRSAYKHVAFKAYMELYKAGLLNDHLLPLTSVIEPELEEEVKGMLKHVERRDGMASVSGQLNPWLPSGGEEKWWRTQLTIEGLPSLVALLTRVEIPALDVDELPILYHPQRHRMEVKLGPSRAVRLSQGDLTAAQESTRRLFWGSYGARMEWSHLDFAYLFVISQDPDADTWSFRRIQAEDKRRSERPQSVNAKIFGSENRYPTNLTWVRDSRFFGKLYRFIGWRHERLAEEEEGEILARPMYSRLGETRVTYPLLIVEPLPQRANFLLPLPSSSETTPEPFFLLAKHSYLELLSPAECEYSQIIPSILRRLETAMIVKSFRSTLFPRPPLSSIPSLSLTTAITAPVSQDPTNYERLETLGDTVLKFAVAVNLLATHPLWHEGYLSKRKDHVVANSRLAKEAIRRSIYCWIIRSRFSPRRFKPLYLSAPEEATIVQEHCEETKEDPVVEEAKARKEVEQLSTKMLADVVEALIGAAYLHGGFDAGVSCAQLFDLGLEWRTLPTCIETVLSRVEHTDEISTQLRNVERMLGYTFRRKLLLVESLTHASCHYDDRTVSYERMEFLGDALLDMIVVDFLYSYPDKDHYRPHDIHTRKSAVVNTHFLAYICLCCSLDVDASMPGPGPHREVVMQPRKHTIRLSQCLQHSSSAILEDQKLMLDRYDNVKDEIEEALAIGRVFPWAALTRLQAPKVFSDMIESLIGAVYLDSEGDMDTVRTLVWRLGILGHLDRIIRDGVQVLHPSVRLWIWASRQHKEVVTTYEEEGGRVICTVSVQGREGVSASAEKRGHASQEEAHFAAAEKAISVWAVSEPAKQAVA